jgi:20S proteasome alpha/beta subunit
MMPFTPFSLYRQALIYGEWYHGCEGRSTPMSIAIALKGANSIVLATDSREVEWVGDANGRTRVSYRENVSKLRALSDYVGIVFASNVPGYDRWVLDLFNETVTNKSSKSFREIVKAFAQLLNKDFYRYVVKGQVKIVTENTLEFVICGYTGQDEPQIVRVNWKFSNQSFAPQLIDSYYHITGVSDIGKYLINKVEDHLPDMSTISLQKLATLLVTETSSTARSVDSDVQMAVIEKGGRLEFTTANEIEQLKKKVSVIVDGEELFRRLNG